MQVFERLEVEFGRWVGWENMVACSSGTAALHLALESLRLSPGAEVICPDFTMIACARAISLAGLTPLFLDCRKQDITLDIDQVDKVCRQRQGRVKAVLAVHVYGRPCDMASLASLGIKYDFRVVEDMAEAHGLIPNEHSHAACWSFYKNKVIAGEEGGAVAFSNPESARLARQLRCLGFTERHDFLHIPRGHNYRLANCLAEKVLTSLGVVEVNVVLRRAIEENYDTFCPDDWRMPARGVPWVYDVRIPGMSYREQDALVSTLNAHGIAARHGFKPMTMQPEYREAARKRMTGRKTMWDVRDQEVTTCNPNAECASREVIYLPLTPDPLDDENPVNKARRTFELIENTVKVMKEG